MSIARVFIKNFRLFRELDLDLNKENLLIIGPNGSGKTSVLEAINLLISRKSIRTRDLKECINDDSEGFSLGVEIKNKHIDLKNLDNLNSLDDVEFDKVIFLIGSSNHHEINKH